MRNQRIVFLVVLIIVAALVTGYLIGRAPQLDAMANAASAKSSPKMSDVKDAARTRKTVVTSAVKQTAASENKTAPTLRDVYADLKRRADANDAAAASELYHDLRRCRFEQLTAQMLPNWVRGELKGDISNATEEQLAMHEKALEGMQHEIDFVQRNAPFCDDSDPDMINQLAPASLKAAQLGDEKALTCYVSGMLLHMPGVLDNPTWLTDFKQNALPLAEQGFQNGDWHIVSLYANAYSGSFVSGLFGQLTGSDPVRAYQYFKLEQLGARAEFLKGMTDQANDAAVDLTAEQIAQADGWAQDMYSRYFSGMPSEDLRNPCGGNEED